MATVPVFVSGYFGLPHAGLNYGFAAAAPAVGSVAFGQMASFLYDREKDPGESKCYGKDCYNLAFSISGSCCLIGVATAVALVLHRKDVERKAASLKDMRKAREKSLNSSRV